MPELEPAQDANTEDVDPSADTETDEPATFANRATRRAKGKGAAQPQPHGTGMRSGGRGPVQGPRQWGTRRSGG